MTINNAQPRIDASQIPLESLAGNASIPEAQKVAEVSRQFEAVLLRQILQDIRKPVLDQSEPESTETGIYSDMINTQMADSISRSGGFGLARSLQTQLGHQILAPAAADSPAAATLSSSAPRPPEKHKK